MAEFEIVNAGAHDMRLFRTWSDEEGWNPGESDVRAFAVADPRGFFVGRLDGESVGCVSAIRYGASFGFLGFYLVRPEHRGKGYGIRLWRRAMEHLEGRLVGLDGVVEQQDNYRRSGFRRAWNNVRFEGVPTAGPAVVDGVDVVDAGSLPFEEVAAYDRRFFPEDRDAFLAAWTGLPGRPALAALRDGRVVGLGVIRLCSGASRIGPLYAEDPATAALLVRALAARAPGTPVAFDAPDANPAAPELAGALGLKPVFEAARMYTGPAPQVELAGIFGVTSLELG
ncbi:GNAT family N-acetyltransferase [Streptomyces sp. NPDC001941]|uniref:GNAT family N-acetyltransferase n=1 Tax=Streptomyces sp. NPDC001941 TaxID=3154659 RepID=UPI003330C701